jgi:hypothetical protein
MPAGSSKSQESPRRHDERKKDKESFPQMRRCTQIDFICEHLRLSKDKSVFLTARSPDTSADLGVTVR